MWCMAIGRDLEPKELAVLFGHKDTPFGGHTPACIIKMLGNSMHAAEAGHFMNAALKFKRQIVVTSCKYWPAERLRLDLCWQRASSLAWAC